MATNPNNAIGTNAAFNGRTTPDAFNDVLSLFTGRGVLSGWQCSPSNNMVVTIGGQSGVRDVAIAEDNAGNKTTVDNISRQPIEIEIAAASTTSASQDYIVAYVNNPPEGTPLAGDNPGACGVIDVRGNGNNVPTETQIRAAITADGGTGTTAYYVVLATVSIPAGATTITNITQGPMSHTVDYVTLDRRISSNETYSTTEQVVGTWTNNKPIYRKVITGSLGVATNKMVEFDVGVPSSMVDEVLPMSCMCFQNTSTNVWSFPGGDENYANRLEFSTASSTLKAIASKTYGAWGNNSVKIVAYYTKK